MPRPIISCFYIFALGIYPLLGNDFEESMERYRASLWEGPVSSNLDISEESRGNQGKTIRLTIPQAIEQVIENNIIVQNAKLEIIKADTPELKNEGRFVWKALAGAQSFKQLLPFNLNNIFGGTKRSQDRLAVGIEKDFKTGTYFKAEVSTLRFDTNAFEDPNNPFTSGFSTFAAPPMYTGAFSVKLSQELLKYSFGKTEENRAKVLKNQTQIVRDRYIEILTNLVVKILVDYWSLNVLDAQIKTYERLLKSTDEIRTITARKKSLGLSEAFEINQWNQAYFKIASSLEKVKAERKEAERDLVRILGVDPGSSIAGVTDLQETLPANWFGADDIHYALEHRIDYKLLKKQKEIADLFWQNAQDEDTPSLKASFGYSSIGQNFLSPQENFLARQRGITSFLFPQITAEIDLSYPLWDKGVKAGIEEATINQKETDLELSLLKQTIEQEVVTRKEAVLASYQVFQEFTKQEQEQRKFTNGLIERFKQGRFSANQVKRALDTLLQVELAVIQSKIGFNINLVRYDLTKNYLFEKYGVDLYGILAELEKRSQMP